MNIQRQDLRFTAQDFSDVMDAIVDASFSLSQALEVVPAWSKYGYACRVPEGTDGGYRIDRTLAERPRWEYADVVGGLLSYRVEGGWNANSTGMVIYENGGFTYTTMGGTTMDIIPWWGTIPNGPVTEWVAARTGGGNYATITKWDVYLLGVRVGGTLWKAALSVGFSPDGEPQETDEDLKKYLGNCWGDRTEEIAALDA